MTHDTGRKAEDDSAVKVCFKVKCNSNIYETKIKTTLDAHIKCKSN